MQRPKRNLLTTSGLGFLIGLLCCAQASEALVWMPENVFYGIHLPAFLVANLFIQSEQALVLMPVTIILQWTSTGALGGFIWNMACRSWPKGR
jgi:hypothetical protein